MAGRGWSAAGRASRATRSPGRSWPGPILAATATRSPSDRSGGIGRGSALAMGAGGARVAAVDLDAASAAETARLLMGAGGKGASIQADTSRAADVDRAVSSAVSQLGPLDIMVTNAGILDGYFNVDETDDAVWDRVIGINLSGVFHGCKRALREMLPRGRGRIINMASVAGLNGTGG